MPLLDFLPVLLQGAWVTVVLTVATLVCSSLLAVPVALARRSTARPPAFAALTYNWVMRGVPELVILFFAFFGLPLMGVQTSPLFAAIVGFTLYNVAYIAEVFRAGLESVGTGQYEAAASLGISPARTLWRIVAPQAVAVVIPPYITQSTEIVKGSALAAVVSVNELAADARVLINATYRPFEILALTALLYLLINSALLAVQTYAERNLQARQWSTARGLVGPH
jgi:His/Glu/Gln/Arg/opine family amino acid ABC transporter permease subunit